MENINTLQIYGNSFQSKCIATLICDRPFLERIVDILLPEYFETEARQWIIEVIVNYFLEYKEIPTKEVFKVKANALSSTQEVLKFGILEELKSAYSHLTDTDMKFVQEQFLTFCKQQRLKRAILKSGELLINGDYEKIKHEIDDAMKAGIERNLGHEYLLDVEQRMSQMARECVKTNWPILDQRMDGGLGKGELGFIVAPAGSGKSWLLTRLGAEAIKQGKNVMHFTLELNENYVGLRYDAYFTGINFQEVRKNIPVVKSKIDEIKNNGGGQLFVKYFPLKTVSPQYLKMHVDRLKMVMGISIDMIIVDYADILRPFMTDRNSNSYSEAGSVYEELRQIAGELQIPVWSASQANRSAHNDEVVQAHNVADSYRKIMTGDFIISLARNKEHKITSTGTIHIIKNRFGQDGDTFPMEFDTSMGISKIYDPNTPEGKAVIAKSKDPEKSTNDILKERWNKLKGQGKFQLNDSEEEE